MKMALTNDLKSAVVEEAKTLGFDAVGFAHLAGQGVWRAGVARWAEQGYAGGMAYLADIRRRAEDFERKHPNLKTAIVLAANYYSKPKPSSGSTPRFAGRVARYAWGRDYHQVLAEAMQKLCSRLREDYPDALFVPCVDTRPLSERSLAVEAGLGFIGRQGQLISPELGPWLFLCEVLTDLELAAEAKAPVLDGCGSCTLCVDTCPTEAIRDDRTIDARRCISYLTIEHKGEIPREFQAEIKDWVFGCDECLAVCPYTQAERETHWEAFQPAQGWGEFLDLDWVLSFKSNRAYERAVAHSAVSRARRKQLARNASVVLANLKRSESAPWRGSVGAVTSDIS